MKMVLWISFYFMSFMALLLGMYFAKDNIVETTSDVPVLNYTKYHRNAVVADSSYTETIDSLAVVVEGLLTEMTGYVSQLQDRDIRIAQQKNEILKLTKQVKEFQRKVVAQQKATVKFNRQQDEKKLQAMAKMLGSMKVETLKPVLKNLSDNIVQILYEKAKAKDRTKIVDALSAERAGKILTQIAEN